MKGVDVLVSSLQKRHVELFPSHTLDTEVSKAASAEEEKKKTHILSGHFVCEVKKMRMGEAQKQESYFDVKSLGKRNAGREMRGGCAPVTSVAVRVERDHADS